MGQWKAKLWTIKYLACLCGWVGGHLGWTQDFVELFFDSCSSSTQTGMLWVINTDLDVHH